MHDVIIIGAGPSGSTLALLLCQMGIKTLVVSKHSGTANTPRAHIFNQRAMEALRDAGIEKQLHGLASDTSKMMHTSWLESLLGEEYGRIYAWGNKPSAKGEYEEASPCMMSDLPQSVLEPVLVEEAKKQGAEYRFRQTFEKLENPEGDKDGLVTVWLTDRATSQRYSLRAKYLIGADGARSAVLNNLEIPIIGQQLNNAFNVHIRAEMSHLFAHRPGSLNWIINVESSDWSAVGNFRMVRPWNEFVVSLHPASTQQPKDGDEDFTPETETILQRLHQLIGDSKLPKDQQVPIEILSAYRWSINDQHAKQWQKGRVLCIGDAVHRHPPINGLGSNTCIGDAFNLAWKLAYVLKGIAGPRILETLTKERAQVGEAIVHRANEGMRAHRHLWSLLGLTPEDRQHVLSIMSSPTPDGEDYRLRVRQAQEATDAEVQALGIQMNQFYHNVGSQLVVSEQASERIPSLSTRDVPKSSDLLRHIVRTTEPGFHLPHVWLAADGQSARISTLDICGKGAFTLLTGMAGAGKWKGAVNALKQDAKIGSIPLRAHSIGFRQDYLDVYDEWRRVREVGDDGAVLVRPDHFVAWRVHSLAEVNNDPAAALRSVFSSMFG